MNKIVKEHYPVEKLPEDLRAGLGAATHVRITVVLEDEQADAALLDDLDRKLHKAKADVTAGRGLSVEQVKANLALHIARTTAKAT